jgi:hypothetical protein
MNDQLKWEWFLSVPTSGHRVAGSDSDRMARSRLVSVFRSNSINRPQTSSAPDRNLSPWHEDS